MKKIFVNTPYSSDANSFWRCMGPLSYMAKQSEGEIQVDLPIDGTKIYWDRLDKYDLIFMHRPCSDQDLLLLQMARLQNIPVWSDYDDWLFHLPPWNPHRGSYHDPNRQQIIAACIACSDIVTVTTGALVESLSRLNPRVLIVPNAYRSDLFPYSKILPERKSIYVWRGTNTHEGDVLPLSFAFKSLSRPVHFLGGPPYSLTSQMKEGQYQIVPPVNPILYWKNIHEMAPKVWLCPLNDHYFNHCKSNISWIEAMHAGAVCVAPDLPEWKHSGIATYEVDNAKSFFDTCEQVMAMPENQIKKYVEDGREEIQAKYDIKVVNQIRTTIFESIFHPSFERNKKDPFNQLTGMWHLSQLKKGLEDDHKRMETQEPGQSA